MLAAIPRTAGAQSYGLGLKLSTLGISLDAARAFGPQFNARLGANFFAYNQSAIEADDFEFDGNVTLLSFSVLADWFPFRNFLKVTGGTLINFNSGELTITPTQTYEIGGKTYSPEDMGVVTGDVNFNLFSPYLGVGMGNAGTAKGFAFAMDVGVIYHGTPDIALESDPILHSTADQDELLESNLEWLQFYPVLSFGVSYRL